VILQPSLLNNQPSRLRGTAFLLGLGFNLGLNLGFASPALAQQSGDSAAVRDKAFDCAVFKQAITAASDGFASLRSDRKSDSDSIAKYAVTAPLFGACEIFEKKKVNEVGYSCEAATLTLADIKATVEACLGDKAQAYASNENPNTPFLRYTVSLKDRAARVLVMKTFGKQTLVIFNSK
jgi:hypothetical protein